MFCVCKILWDLGGCNKCVSCPCPVLALSCCHLIGNCHPKSRTNEFPFAVAYFSAHGQKLIQQGNTGNTASAAHLPICMRYCYTESQVIKFMTKCSRLAPPLPLYRSPSLSLFCCKQLSRHSRCPTARTLRRVLRGMERGRVLQCRGIRQKGGGGGLFLCLSVVVACK